MGILYKKRLIVFKVSKKTGKKVSHSTKSKIGKKVQIQMCLSGCSNISNYIPYYFLNFRAPICTYLLEGPNSTVRNNDRPLNSRKYYLVHKVFH